MSVINTGAKEIHCKIVYYGPESAGKKSAIRHIRDQFEESKRKFCALPFEKSFTALFSPLEKFLAFRPFFIFII